MFNIGMMELMVIAALALIFIGPKQLPEVARTVGRVLNELKRAGEEAFGSLNDVRANARRLVDETESKIANPVTAKDPLVTPDSTETVDPAPSEKKFDEA